MNDFEEKPYYIRIKLTQTERRNLRIAAALVQSNLQNFVCHTLNKEIRQIIPKKPE